MKRFLAFSLSVLALSILTAKEHPQYDNLSTAELARFFRQPPMQYRPYVWWHWMGSNFSKEGIRRDLEAMHESGIAGATIFNLTSAVQESHRPIENCPWPEQTYRSAAYWDALRYAAELAGRLGMEIGLHNSPGYTTSAATRRGSARARPSSPTSRAARCSCSRAPWPSTPAIRYTGCCRRPTSTLW